MFSEFSWQNSVILCPASFCILRLNLPITPYFLTSYNFIPVPSDEKDIYIYIYFFCTGGRVQGTKICYPIRCLFGMWPVAMKAQKIKKDPLTFPLTAKRGLDKGPIPEKEFLDKQHEYDMNQVWQAGRSLAKSAAAAMLLQSCPTLCDPIDHSPLSSPIPGILQARTLEWVSMSFSSA